MVGSFHVMDRVDEEGLQRVVRRARRPNQRRYAVFSACQHARSGCCVHTSARRSRRQSQHAQVRILYGEGDRFGCWLDVAADAIVWHALGAPDAGAMLPAPAAAPPGADLAPARLQVPQLLPLGASDWVADMWAERGVMARLAGGGGAPGAGQPEAIADSAVRATARGRSSANARARALGRRGRDERKSGAETSL